ncbi:alcohol dehydrogenase catalytic domain-containing protein [Streptomyces sp. NPDC096310]|uniref:alcohol dehydrogenase catalytic domain-containing protein n=1 Tax=Streptomyces sp. NPDC096310 TaxID=3366082 RepID=UPI003802AA80
MKSWRFHGTGRPLTPDEVPAPHAGPGEVVVDVKAAGLCHSDVGALDDPQWMTSFPRIPMTLGHENAGVISEVGPGMEAWKVGDRVGLAPVRVVRPQGDAPHPGRDEAEAREDLRPGIAERALSSRGTGRRAQRPRCVPPARTVGRTHHHGQATLRPSPGLCPGLIPETDQFSFCRNRVNLAI